MSRTQTRLDLPKLAYAIREKLWSGVALSDGRVVAVHLSEVHLTYVEMRGDEVKVRYMGTCIDVYVDAVVEGKDIKIANVELVSCGDCGKGVRLKVA
jgi:hypothetical protein